MGKDDNDPATDGYLSIPKEGGRSRWTFGDILSKRHRWCKTTHRWGFRTKTLIPVASGPPPSSDLEARLPYYYDMANMKTQGGNLDYGLRQYVSVVEFKAGPPANPHAARTITKRATSTITQAIATTTSNQHTLTLEDTSLFPDVDMNAGGDLLYVAEVMLDTFEVLLRH